MRRRPAAVLASRRQRLIDVTRVRPCCVAIVEREGLRGPVWKGRRRHEPHPMRRDGFEGRVCRPPRGAPGQGRPAFWRGGGRPAGWELGRGGGGAGGYAKGRWPGAPVLA